MRAINHLQIIVAVALLSSARVAGAAPPEKPKPQATDASPATALRAAEDMLASEDPAIVRKGVDALGELGGEPAASALSARLRRGLPPQLIEHAVLAVQRVGKPSAAPILLELALHRRAQIRRRAIAALGALKVRVAQSALLYALDDPSAEVREAAVLALAEIGNARALPPLFAAAERGMPHALTAIGKIATARDVKAIVRRAKDGDVTRIKPVLEVMLERKDFPVQGKLLLVRELAALGQAGARNHLVQWLDAWKSDGDPRLKQALFDAIKRLDRMEAPATAQPMAKPGASSSKQGAASAGASGASKAQPASRAAGRPEVAAAGVAKGAKP